MELQVETYGTKIRVQEGVLFLEHKEKETTQVPIKKVSTVVVGRGIKITTDTMFALIDAEVELVLIGKAGDVNGRIWSVKYGSISTIRRNQLKFRDSLAAVVWVKNMIKQKLNHQKLLLETILDEEGKLKKELSKDITFIDKMIDRLEAVEVSPMDDISDTLRGIEGSASRKYFKAISSCLPDMYQFERRSRRPAIDMFNALLNYSYGMLYRHVEHALITAGLDPYTGIFHVDDYNRPVFVFDFIEPYRVWADRVVINLCLQQVIFIEFFEVEESGYFLNSMGKQILVQSFNDYLNEVIEIEKISRKRINHIQFNAQRFATFIKTLSENEDAA